MHPAIENFLNRPKSHKLGAWAAAVLLLSFALWQYLLSPKIDEHAEAAKKVSELEKKLLDEKRRALNLPKLREMVKELETKLKVALKELPDRREIPDLIDLISNLARDSGLEVTLFKPGEQVFKDFYAEVPVSVAVTGTFHQVATFFDEVGHMDRIVNINQIFIHDAQITESQMVVKVDCVATTFRYLDDSERSKQAGDAADAGAAKRRKR